MKYACFILMAMIITIGCRRSGIPVNDERNDTPCGPAVIINADSFRDSPTDPYKIISASVSGNCLNITIGSSGCNSDAWKAILIDAGAIAKSLPPQRSLKMTLENKQDCLAYFTKVYSFDIHSLRVEGMKKVTLNLDGYNKALEYAY